jgi:hypothetical protein
MHASSHACGVLRFSLNSHSWFILGLVYITYLVMVLVGPGRSWCLEIRTSTVGWPNWVNLLLEDGERIQLQNVILNRHLTMDMSRKQSLLELILGVSMCCDCSLTESCNSLVIVKNILFQFLAEATVLCNNIVSRMAVDPISLLSNVYCGIF